MVQRKSYISVRKKYIEELQKECGVSRTSVYNALNYSCNSDSAKKVRDLALTKYEGIKASRPVFA